MVRNLSVALVALGLAIGVCMVQGQEAQGLAGKWILVGTLPSAPVGRDSVLGLVEIKGSGNDLKAEWLKHGIDPFKDSKIADFKKNGDKATFRIDGRVNLDVALVGVDSKSKRLAGAFKLNGNWFPATLIVAPKGELPEKDKLEEPAPGSDAVKGVMEKAAFNEKLELAEKVLKDHPASASAIKVGTLVADYALKDAKPEEVKKAVEFQEKALAGLPEVLVQRSLIPTLGSMGRKNVEKEFGLALLRRIKGDAKTASDETLALMKLEASLLEGVDDKKAADLKLAITKQEEDLDQIFLKTAIPFKPEPFDGTKRKSKRVTVLELFTGAQCPPCVAADVAFDALAESFKPSDVVLLQYHLHIPGPDPLTNRDAENRARFYGIRSTPTVVINGKTGPALGGFKGNAKASYDKARDAVKEELEKSGDSTLELSSATKGDAIELTAKYSKVANADKSVLRFCVLEDVVRYQGRNGQRLHHHVVRGFPGGLNGQALEQSTGTLRASLDLKDLKAQLESYLETSNAQRPYLDSERPLELKKLKAVVFLQNAETKEITNAAQVNLELPKAPK
jgi:hypothetical protein